MRWSSSNFNTYGGDAPATKEWPPQTRQAFLDHMAKGNGLVIVHAGSSVFYDWPEFQNLACGTWKDGTGHGAIHVSRVTFTDQESPITKGLEPFWIRDEFWQKIHVAPGAKPLASVTPDPAFKAAGSRKTSSSPPNRAARAASRSFSGTMPLAMKTALGKPCSSAAPSGPPPATATSPNPEPNHPMKIGCFALIQPFSPMRRQFELIRELGFDYADLTDNHDGATLGTEYGFSASFSLDSHPATILDMVNEFGLTLTSVCAHANLLDPTSPDRYGTARSSRRSSSRISSA
jgi:hypothetical protein